LIIAMPSAQPNSPARARHPFVVNIAAAAFRRPRLLKLAFEGLPVGGCSGITDQVFFQGEFPSFLTASVTL
jgi:hypothetical protein